MEVNKRHSLFKKEKDREVLNSHSSYDIPLLSHPNSYSGTKTWNSQTLKYWHPNDSSECYLATSCHNSRLSTGVGKVAEQDTLRRSARTKVSCPLGLETSQKGKGQMHSSPSLPISGWWDCGKSRQRKLEVERQEEKARTGEERNAELTGVTHARVRTVLRSLCDGRYRAGVLS